MKKSETEIKKGYTQMSDFSLEEKRIYRITNLGYVGAEGLCSWPLYFAPEKNS